MRMMPRALQAPRTDGARGAGGSFSIVGAQRTVQNNGNVKSEPKYLAYMKDLQYVLSTVELFLVLFLLYGGLTSLFFFFVRVASRPAALSSRFCT